MIACFWTWLFGMVRVSMLHKSNVSCGRHFCPQFVMCCLLEQHKDHKEVGASFHHKGYVALYSGEHGFQSGDLFLVNTSLLPVLVRNGVRYLGNSVSWGDSLASLMLPTIVLLCGLPSQCMLSAFAIFFPTCTHGHTWALGLVIFGMLWLMVLITPWWPKIHLPINTIVHHMER